MRAALGEPVESSEQLVDAVAKLQLSLDRARLLVLQKAATTVLALDLPDIDTHTIPLLDDGAVPPVLWESLSIVQHSLENLSEEMKELAGQSVHSRVKEWVGVVQAAARALYNKSEAIRWQLLELEADADIAAGRVMRFSSSGNAAAYLRRIGK